MWTSVVYLQAKSEKPLLPIILLLVLFLILLNLDAFPTRSSSPTIYDFNINFAKASVYRDTVLLHNNSQYSFAYEPDKKRDVIQMPMNMITALKHARRVILRDVVRMQ